MTCLTFTCYLKREMVTQLVDLSSTWFSGREVYLKFKKKLVIQVFRFMRKIVYQLLLKTYQLISQSACIVFAIGNRNIKTKFSSLRCNRSMFSTAKP